MADDQELLNRAADDYGKGRYAEAAATFREVLSRHPDVADLHLNLGAALRAAGDAPGAELAYRRALELLPTHAMAWFNLGNVLQAQDRNDEALKAYLEADRLQPGTPEIIGNIGVQLYAAGDIEAALEHYERALAINPGWADALTNRGNALQRLGRMTDAEAALTEALALDPENAIFLLNMSAFTAANGRYGEALEWAEKSISADPSYVEAKLKKASLLIQQGNLVDGFELYEARWARPAWHPLPASTDVPMWSGEDLRDKHLVIWNEQGYGDALLYARYIPELLKMAERLTLLCEAPLQRLMRGTWGDAVTVENLSAVPPGADFHVSMMSLPHLLGSRIETIPRESPYLIPPKESVAAWRQRLDNAEGLRVGLIWAGNPKQAHDYTRSISESEVLPLLDTAGVTFFNLLVGPRGDTLIHENVQDLRQDIDDFVDTAAIMKNLDLVISVDSAPAHLAGSVGVPVWILLAYDPDSRYFLGRNDCPWYPSARLFRHEKPGDWPSVVTVVAQELSQLASA